MKTRQLVIVAGLVIFFGGIFGMKYLSSLKETSARKTPPPAIRSAEYVDVLNVTQQAKIPVTGKTISKEKIDIYAEVSGNLLSSSSKFKVGNSFSKGQVLISIDNSELSLSVQSLKSNFLSVLTRVLPDLKLDYPDVFEAWKSYADNFSVTKRLADLPEIKGKEKYFLSTQGVLNQYYSIKSQEARLAKFTIEAPFSGIVSESNINPGTLVRVGQKLGSFIKTNVFEVEVSIDLSHLPYVSQGSEVVLRSNQIAGEYLGKVTRVSQALDPATQSAKVVVEVSDEQLKEGMYLTGCILTTEFESVFILTKNQINSNNETFVIENGALKAVKINPLFIGENEVVTADLKTGDKILKSLYDGAFDGALVRIEGGNEPETKSLEKRNGSATE